MAGRQNDRSSKGDVDSNLLADRWPFTMCRWAGGPLVDAVHYGVCDRRVGVEQPHGKAERAQARISGCGVDFSTFVMFLSGVAGEIKPGLSAPDYGKQTIALVTQR